IFHERGGTYRLTPFYDVLSAWPIIGPKQLDFRKTKLAMAVRSKNALWKLAEIQTRHWDAVFRSAGLGSARPLLEEIVSQTPAAIETVNEQLPRNFPSVVCDKIFERLQVAATEISSALTEH